MKNFEELAFEWYDTICFSDKYAYRTEKMNATSKPKQRKTIFQKDHDRPYQYRQ